MCVNVRVTLRVTVRVTVQVTVRVTVQVTMHVTMHVQCKSQCWSFEPLNIWGVFLVYVPGTKIVYSGTYINKKHLEQKSWATSDARGNLNTGIPSPTKKLP